MLLVKNPALREAYCKAAWAYLNKLSIQENTGLHGYFALTLPPEQVHAEALTQPAVAKLGSIRRCYEETSAKTCSHGHK